MDELLDKSWGLPLSGGKCVVDVDKMRDLIDDIRINLPTEIKHAQAIVVERNEIIEVAKKEGEVIIRKAEDRAKSLVSNQEIVKASQSKATDIMSQSQMKAKEIRRAAQEFSDEVLRTTEEAMTKSLGELRSVRQALRSAGKRTLTSPQELGTSKE